MPSRSLRSSVCSRSSNTFSCSSVSLFTRAVSRKLSNDASMPIWNDLLNFSDPSSSATFFCTRATTRRCLSSSTRIGSSWEWSPPLRHSLRYWFLVSSVPATVTVVTRRMRNSATNLFFSTSGMSSLRRSSKTVPWPNTSSWFQMWRYDSSRGVAERNSTRFALGP